MHTTEQFPFTHVLRRLVNISLILPLLLCCFPMQTRWARAMPNSTFTVDATTDGSDDNLSDGLCRTNGGDCTLRAAIQQANASLGADTIVFDDKILLVTLEKQLPALSDTNGGTTIFGGSNKVHILGNVAGDDLDGFTLNSNNNKIQGLEIVGFDGNGIVINGDNNFIGVDSNSANDDLEGNIIRSCGKNGVLVNLGAENNRIAGNLFSVDRSGNPYPNAWNGIDLGGANNRVGVFGDNFSDHLEGNYIARNGQNGISITNSGNVVAGNTVYFNTGEGILVSQTYETLIGTNGDGVGDLSERNLIYYNQQNGIKLYDDDVTTIAGNVIGTNGDGLATAGNMQNGIYAIDSYGGVIGTDGAGLGAAAEGNLISANKGSGIKLENSTMFTIAGNKVGTDLSGTLALRNFDGIQLSNSYSNTIGVNGDGVGDAFEGNLVSGNGGNGIVLLNSTSNQNTIAGNRIGVNISGTQALPNEEYGIFIQGGGQNLIGYDGTGATIVNERNIISGNTLSGIYLKGNENRIAGNYIGMDASGTVAIPNHWGITIVDAISNFIGTNSDSVGDANEGNWISGNQDGGILIKKSAATSSLNKVYGNKIGVNASGTGALPNNGPGILLENVGGNSIGGNLANQGNLIKNHPAPGIRFTSNGEVTGNRFLGNSMANNQFGIDLGNDLHTDNDTGDGDLGPNGLQNYPVLVNAGSTGDTLSVVVNFNSKAGRNYYLDFYWTPVCHTSGYGEGQVYLGSTTVITGGTGNFLGQVAIFASGLLPGYITATAADEGFSTSEFSACTVLQDVLDKTFLPIIIR